VAGIAGAAPSRALAALIHGAWTSFIKTGNPGWPAYTVPDRRAMIFEAESRVEADALRLERESGLTEKDREAAVDANHLALAEFRALAGDEGDGVGDLRRLGVTVEQLPHESMRYGSTTTRVARNRAVLGAPGLTASNDRTLASLHHRRDDRSRQHSLRGGPADIEVVRRLLRCLIHGFRRAVIDFI